MRETVESIIIAFVLAFVFRAFVVEAFVIPTGSMAPTLLGQHDHVFCPMCGYRFNVGPPNASVTSSSFCPMCDVELDVSASGPESGDRILVLKYIYTFREPERFDVVVFKNPTKPEENYIKRLVGLPGEQLMIVGGNVYTRPLQNRNGDWLPPVDGSDPSKNVAWQIQRKPEHVQRAVWQEVYHSKFYPLDAQERGWQMPWQPVDVEGWTFHRAGPHYRFDGAGDNPGGTIEFVFDERRKRDYFHYNMFASPQARGEDELDEMRLAAVVHPETEGLRVVLESTGRLADEEFRAVIEADGGVLLQKAQNGQWATLAEGAVEPLSPDRASSLEFWHADQRLSLWIDGEMVLEHAYEHDLRVPEVEAALRRPGKREPRATISVQGAAVTIRSMELDRDLHYTQGDNNGGAFGSQTNPAVIPPDRFFVMGDNSPSSADSRLWTGTDEWVDYYTNVEVGLVPRELMIGRAFFVYFPAPLPLGAGGMHIVPNFGRMRFIH